MTSDITLEHLEQQVTQIPTHDQIKLVTFITEQLLASPLIASPHGNQQKHVSHRQIGQLKDWFAECDQVADLWEGDFETDLHRIRHEEK